MQQTENVLLLNQAELQEFCGNNDEKIRLLQSQIDAKAVIRGNKMKIIGDAEEVEHATKVVMEILRTLKETGTLSVDEFRQATRFSSQRARQGLGPSGSQEQIDVERQSYLDENYRSPKKSKPAQTNFVKDNGKPTAPSNPGSVPQPSSLFSEHIDVPMKKKLIKPLTLTQKNYADAIRNNTVTFGVGPAGTGKTYVAMAMAASLLNEGAIKRIILCRPAVEAGERLGFLPGDLAQKFDPYVRPLYDALYEMMEGEQIKRAMEAGVIEIAPLAFMRGRTLNHAFVILDEGQNTSVEQMKMFLTRLGHDSKAVVTGDDTQVDLPRGQMSGLIHAQKVLNNINGVGIIRFQRSEVVRHPLLTKIIERYEADNMEKKSKSDDQKAAAKKPRDEVYNGTRTESHENSRSKDSAAQTGIDHPPKGLKNKSSSVTANR